MKHTLGLALGIWVFMLGSLCAKPRIGGNVSYQFGPGNTTVTLSFDAITNSSAENATGTIMMQLWAMSAPYESGTLRGHVVASYKLEGLDAGLRYSNLKKTVKTSMPPRRGDYYMCLTVSEYRESGYVITDFRNMTRVITLAPAAPAKATLTGPWSWQSNIAAGTVTINVKKITNNKGAKTGSLRLAVWATRQPFTGGKIAGFQLGSVDKKPLEKGYSYSDVVNTAKLKTPPAGTYYTTLFLLEYNGEEYVMTSYLTASKAVTFK